MTRDDNLVSQKYSNCVPYLLKKNQGLFSLYSMTLCVTMLSLRQQVHRLDSIELFAAFSDINTIFMVHANVTIIPMGDSDLNFFWFQGADNDDATPTSEFPPGEFPGK